MQSVNRRPGMRRDPAPSRWAYRMQRLWLTPFFRVFFRVGLPVLAVALVTALILANADRRTAIVASISGLRDQFERRPEFLVGLIRVEGASPELSDAVRAKLGLRLPQSSFDLDIDVAREKIESLDAVASAIVRVRSGGILQVLITERVPTVIWRSEGKLTLLDDSGHRVAGLAARADRADLPVIAGDGADREASEALMIFEAAAPLAERLRGLIRVGDRRWTVVMDRDQTILLPQDQPVAALERFLALDAAEDILARDLRVVDLRLEKRPTLQLAPEALNTLYKIETKEDTTTESNL